MAASPTTSAPAVPASGAEFYSHVRSMRTPWVWWHLLSFDAPTVAVVWCWFFASAFGLTLPSTCFFTLALGTWCVYVGDRLLDGWRSTDTFSLRDRHWFYLRHRGPFVLAWTAAAVPLAYLIFFRVPNAVRTDDIILCLIGCAYFLLIHGRTSPGSSLRWFPKEFAVGFLFSIATAVPTWTRLDAGRSLWLCTVFTFGAACWLNCVAIQTWEDAEAMRGGMGNIFSKVPHTSTRASPRDLTEFLGNHLSVFAIAVWAVALAFGILTTLTATSPLWPLFAAVGLSSLLFLALIRQTERFSALSLRILADCALLTPLIFFLPIR